MNIGHFRGFEVKVEEPGIAWIRFNEPEKLNGMHAGKKRDLIETLTQAQMDNDIRVVVFTGEGRGFCAGDDLKASLTSLRSVSERLSRGEGTLGKLLGDETLLRDMKSLMRKADRALDGMGDSGPLTAVGVLANGLF